MGCGHFNNCRAVDANEDELEASAHLHCQTGFLIVVSGEFCCSMKSLPECYSHPSDDVNHRYNPGTIIGTPLGKIDLLELSVGRHYYYEQHI